jgi:nicotinic acid mononucleotide adenylyltransferase
VRERIVDLRGLDENDAERKVGASVGLKIYVTDAVNVDVSATEIRRAVREGREADWPGLVHPAVADYIRKYRLYREA